MKNTFKFASLILLFSITGQMLSANLIIEKAKEQTKQETNKSEYTKDKPDISAKKEIKKDKTLAQKKETTKEKLERLKKENKAKKEQKAKLKLERKKAKQENKLKSKKGREEYKKNNPKSLAKKVAICTATVYGVIYGIAITASLLFCGLCYIIH